jgi:hypothetical protein
MTCKQKEHNRLAQKSKERKSEIWKQREGTSEHQNHGLHNLEQNTFSTILKIKWDHIWNARMNWIKKRKGEDGAQWENDLNMAGLSSPPSSISWTKMYWSMIKFYQYIWYSLYDMKTRSTHGKAQWCFSWSQYSQIRNKIKITRMISKKEEKRHWNNKTLSWKDKLDSFGPGMMKEISTFSLDHKASTGCNLD